MYIQKLKSYVLLSAVALLVGLQVTARENVNGTGRSISYVHSYKVDASACAPGTSKLDLNINNVRAKMLNAGDMWWDLTSAKYEVPKIDPTSGQVAVSSMFAGSVWVGGYDQGGQLKIAAATYRQNGNDWFPGYLDASGSAINQVCSDWDRHFQVFGSEIDQFLSDFNASSIPGYLAPNLIASNIKNWPGKGNRLSTLAVPNQDLAPFYDYDHNGIYNPDSGDYPIVISDPTGKHHTYADQMIWWVVNDKGNVHTETGGQQIGMEMQTLAFAFKTNDEFNDMTFYRYTLLNKSTAELDSVFMGQWCDFDLGYAFDDYTGCDTSLSLGIGYNGKAYDGPAVACYGDQPPMIGADYFEGPTNEKGKQLGMSNFLYYSNDFSVTGNPTTAQHYYNYLSGTWTDGTFFTVGGNGHGGAIRTHFMFPGDPTDKSTWSECSANNAYGDRRFLQSSGPFKLVPGKINHITVGVVWVRPPKGTYPCPSFNFIRRADRKAQALFDNNFELFTGPASPNLNIVELNQELIINIDSSTTSSVENYDVPDPTLFKQGVKNPDYKFEGYQVYQVSDVTVTATYSNLNDPTKARLIAQCDKANGASKIVNYVFDASLNYNIPTLMVTGENKGLKHSFHVTTDQFATGDAQLVNFHNYYFLVISYAYNSYYDSVAHTASAQLVPDLSPYLAGSRNVQIYTGIPHNTASEFSGQILNSKYGDQPSITRVEGMGSGQFVNISGRNTIDLTQATEDEILLHDSANSLVYQAGRGPIQVQVVDPKKVMGGDYELTIKGDNEYDTIKGNAVPKNPAYVKDTAHWVLKRLSDGVTVRSQQAINTVNEQLIENWGISVNVKQCRGIGYNGATFQDNNGFIEATTTFSNPENQWLSGVGNQPNQYFGWIQQYNAPKSNSPNPLDSAGAYSNIFGGSFAPFVVASAIYTSPTSSDQPVVYFSPDANDANVRYAQQHMININTLSSIDVVLTSDKSKWSKCIVVETQNSPALSATDSTKLALRGHLAWKGTFTNGVPDYDTTTANIGYSYFPGYAIDVETGKRLNIFFGENSWLKSDNGDDMIWNPTSNVSSKNGSEVVIGGCHYVYITKQMYDGCLRLHDSLSKGVSAAQSAYKAKKIRDRKRWAYSQINWMSMPIAVSNGTDLTGLSQGIPPCDVRLRVRVHKPYSYLATNTDSTYHNPRFRFNLDGYAAKSNNAQAAQSALDLINIVPNPYYGFSNYETNQLDFKAKITNLPQQAKITIYTLNGVLVRTLNFQDNKVYFKSDNNTSIDWDLKNDAGVSISSGVYLIHIEAPGIGERVIKWFGVMRPVDLDNF